MGIYDIFIDDDVGKEIQIKALGGQRDHPWREIRKGDDITHLLEKEGQWDLHIDGEFKKRTFPTTCTFFATYTDPENMLYAHVKDGVFIGIDDKVAFPAFDTWGKEFDKGSFARWMFLYILDCEGLKSTERLRGDPKK